MPKQPRLRVNYLADAQYFIRLVHAIEADETRPLEWRRVAMARVQSVAEMFLADGEEIKRKAEEARQAKEAQEAIQIEWLTKEAQKDEATEEVSSEKEEG